MTHACYCSDANCARYGCKLDRSPPPSWTHPNCQLPSQPCGLLEAAAKVLDARAAEYRSAQVGCSLNEALGLEKIATELDHQAAAIRALSNKTGKGSEASAGASVAVPEGWKLVPFEPIEEMLDAAWHQTGESKEMRGRVHERFRRYYAAMLAAAPAASNKGGRDGE